MEKSNIMKILDEIQQTLIQFKTDFDEFKKTEFETVKTDCREIKAVLAGDEFGNKGLVEKNVCLEKKLQALREEVRGIKIIGGVLYSLIGIIIGGLTYFSKH